MNQFFYETRGKEKVRELRREGIASQEYHRSRSAAPGFLGRLPRLAILLLGVLGILKVLLP